MSKHHGLDDENDVTRKQHIVEVRPAVVLGSSRASLDIEPISSVDWMCQIID